MATVRHLHVETIIHQYIETHSDTDNSGLRAIFFSIKTQCESHAWSAPWSRAKGGTSQSDVFVHAKIQIFLTKKKKDWGWADLVAKKKIKNKIIPP